MREDLALRMEVCEIGARLWERGLVGATEGNVTVRLPAGGFLCTPSGLSKGHLQPSDIVALDEQGLPTDGRCASSEIKMHLRIYQRRPDCHAVVHAHPITATGFALAGQTIPDDALPEAALVLGRVALVPFGMPGTDEVPDAMELLLEGHKTFLLANHGAVALGRDLLDAFYRMETLERVARIVFCARGLGGVVSLPLDAQARMKKAGQDGRL